MPTKPNTLVIGRRVTGCTVKRRWSTAGVSPPGNRFAPPGSNQSRVKSLQVPSAVVRAPKRPRMVFPWSDKLPGFDIEFASRMI
jgi:hypothetical protein